MVLFRNEEFFVEETVIVEQKGCSGLIKLNRPKVLNSLNLDMIRTISHAFDRFLEDSLISRVILMGASGKAFCAGADVRKISELVQNGDKEQAYAFFREEYQLNKKIKNYSKTVISIMDGITMGGGVGLAHHGHYRVAGERYVFAMPEVTIGFFPDVGASSILARLACHAGYYLGMTGANISQQTAFKLGLVTHKISSQSFASLIEALCHQPSVEEVLASFSVSSDNGEKNNQLEDLIGHLDFVDKAFSVANAWDVLTFVTKEAQLGNIFAQDTLSLMLQKSPLSMSVAFELIKLAKSLSVDEVLMLDWQLAQKMILSHDFHEGVRAQLIDKDKKPQWKPEHFDLSLQPLVASLFKH